MPWTQSKGPGIEGSNKDTDDRYEFDDTSIPLRDLREMPGKDARGASGSPFTKLKGRGRETADEDEGDERRGLLTPTSGEAGYRDAFEDDEGVSDSAHPSSSSTHQPAHANRSTGAWSFAGRGRDGKDASRTITFGEADRSRTRFPRNVVRNQKYNLVSFLPLVLYEQFKYFFNLYFLLVALSQFIPPLKIGFIATYIAPLAFVLFVTIGKEAVDDHARYKRDVESNSSPYETLVSGARLDPRRKKTDDRERQLTDGVSLIPRPSSKLRVGDIVLLHKNQRVPADMVLLRTTAGDHASTAGARRSLAADDVNFILGGDEDEEQGEDGEVQTARPKGRKEDGGGTAEEEGGTCFVRTDQLDGETDWKLRVAVDLTQQMSEDELAKLEHRASVYAGPPIKDIHTFIGNLTIHPSPLEDTSRPSLQDDAVVGNLIETPDLDTPSRSGQEREPAIKLSRQPQVAPLTAENVLWANTVLAAGSALGVVIYTGKETRAVMNTSHPSTKMGILDLEVNKLSKILCGVTFALSVGLVALNGFRGQWYIYIFRFLILFSSIIPISLRVNLDMGKTVYAHQIMNDPEIPGTLVRTSTLPEELGRIEYLLSDKTGTLTQNEMELKKLHMGTMSYSWDSMDEVARQLAAAMEQQREAQMNQVGGGSGPGSPSTIKTNPMLAAGGLFGGRGRRDMSLRVKDVVMALALCHNVTPVDDSDGAITYQASSPDEVAIVRWTESIGLALTSRDRTSMTLKTLADGATHSFDILEVFPFTSESKRMGIVVRDRGTGELTFYQKGADVVMAKIVTQNDWLDEECGNMAREGLRTLVVGRKRLSEESWKAFERAYKAARVRVSGRNEAVAHAVDEHLERDLELLGLTGVEDKLQDDVRTTLELLRNAGVRVWMLTGDKIETATCIAISSKLVARNQYIHQVAKLKNVQAVREMLDFLRSKLDCCLVIDGESLQLSLDHHKTEFIELATQLTAVVACRCSPTQKADVARLIRAHTRKRVCCIGDGGNDVSMIQAADVGLGIEGKEGKQASLAADFSLTQFSHITKLVVWHGRNSYKRSAKLAQFVIHRGLIISVIQAVFSSIFYFAPIALYQGWLMVGYATVYTMAPVFSLVLDRDVSEDVALLYPELFKDIGRSLSAKTFTEWLIISIYQGGAIMIMSLVVFEKEMINILSISFTALILNELIMVALEITTWHVYMILSEAVTLIIYCISITFLPEFFDLSFVLTTTFLWKTAVIVAVSSLPLYFIKLARATLAPSSYSKLAMS